MIIIIIWLIARDAVEIGARGLGVRVTALYARVLRGTRRGQVEIKTLTYEQQEANRQDRLNEVGTEPPCPFCKRPRVMRSDYIRCNPCGVNWLAEEMGLKNYLNLDPRVARTRSAHTVNSTRLTAEPLAENAE